MALTHRAYAKRRYEDKLVDAVDCLGPLGCGATRGRRCRHRNREVITCCQAREDFGRPILEAQARFKLMLVEVGVLPTEGLWSD